ncbi:MAG: Rne/Rng family ribonuclease [Planctomycetota bacterium]|jgi:ribonuclease E
MALDKGVGEQMPQKTTKKSSTRRARRKVGRRKKKATSAGRGGTVRQAEADAGAEATKVTQLDVGEVSRALPGADSAAPVEVDGNRAQRTKRAKSATRKAGQTGTRSKKKTKKATTTKKKRRPVRSRREDTPRQAGADSSPAAAVTIEHPQPQAKDIPAAKVTRPSQSVSDEQRPGSSPATIREPRARGRRIRRGVRHARPAAAPKRPPKAAQRDSAAAPSAIETPAAPERADATGKAAAVIDKRPSELSGVRTSGKKDDSGVAVVEAPPAERGPRPAKRAKDARARRGRGRAPKRKKKAPAAKARDASTDTDAVAEAADESAGISELRSGREMVINVSAEDECRIAVLNDGRLEELFIERASTQSHVGNIYKGRVTNVEPSIQAVFVDFGLVKNGFLHISDVQPQYFPDHGGEPEDVGRKIPRHNRPPIQKCFRRGQEVIVQVTKEGVGTKGPTLTTYLSIPGRFLVMMPGMNRQGVSRKIEDEADRRKMRDVLKSLKLPQGMGFILRTAGLGQSKRELQRDLNYLQRLWKRVSDRIKRQSAPTDLYQESDLVKRTVRDVYTGDFTRLVVDDPETATKAREFLEIAMPRSKVTIEVYSGREPLFHRLGIEEEINRIHMRHVPLPSGGSIVIDSTEALVAIDVNSGRFRSLENAEESAYKLNLEAADEIARQLRLRDLGGLIVCDFIDMRHDRHQRAVERALRDALKRHKEHARVLRMSAFGLIEMTRQRQGPSYKRNIFFDCPHCKGAGVVKMPESVTLDVMRFIQLAIHQEQVRVVKVTVATDVAFQILNNKRGMISQFEEETGKEVLIRGEAGFTSDQIEYSCEDARGRPVTVDRAGPEATPNPDSEAGRNARRSR